MVQPGLSPRAALQVDPFARTPPGSRREPPLGTCFRRFRNDDPPELVGLWNRGLPASCVVRPLTVHEFDALVMGKLNFESDGLIVAERDGQVVGFAHAGFGPIEPKGLRQALDRQLGTVAMVAIEPNLDDPDLELGLFTAAERYLRRRGAEVFYAGGQYPLNPFYWGIYGGGEYSGVLSHHLSFHRAARRCGYVPSASAVVLESDLARPEPRDPKLIYLRRQVRLDVLEDTLPEGWWQALAIGLFRPSRFVLRRRTDDAPIARAAAWEIACGFGIGDGRPRTGLIELEVEPAYRRQGYGRLMVAEVLRYAREQLSELVVAHTPESNLAARALYAGLGFEQIEATTTFRLPAELGERSLG